MAKVPLKLIEDGFGCSVLRSPYTPYSIYLGGAIDSRGLSFVVKPMAFRDGKMDCP